MNTISEDDKKRIIRACTSVNDYSKPHVNFTNKTIALLNDSRNFVDDSGNTILHLLLVNGYFDVDVLNGLLANGHNINAVNNQGLSPMGQVNTQTYDFIEKFNWCVENGASYIVAKKDENGNFVNDIAESTKVFLELVVSPLSFLMCDIDGIKSKVENVEDLEYSDKRTVRNTETMRNRFDRFIELCKKLIEIGIITNDLTTEPEFIYYNPTVIFMPVDYLKKVETVMKLNWDIDKLSQSALYNFSMRRTQKYKLPYIRGPDIFRNLDHNIVIPLCEYVQQRANDPKKFFTMLGTLTGTAKIQYEVQYVGICKQYDDDKERQEEFGFIDSYFENLIKSKNHTKKVIDTLAKVNSFSCEVYS